MAFQNNPPIGTPTFPEALEALEVGASWEEGMTTLPEEVKPLTGALSFAK